MFTFLDIVFLLLGMIVGSFLNVVIYRFNTHKTFGGRSVCMSCKNQICWYDLVPVFSFCFLSGRCRHCSSKISWQYPAVELATGIMFLLLFSKFEFIFWIDPLVFAYTFGFFATLFSVLMVITVYDLKHKIIPDTLSLVFGTLAFMSVFIFSDLILYVHMPTLYSFLGILIALPFAFFFFVSGGRWMGFGDAKLAIGIGLLLGLAKGLSAVALAFWIGALVGILLVILGKVRGIKSEIPFAPFLALGTFLTFLLEFNFFNLPY
jgi:leader peptidase (prepilin peptidase)/N-methyltransferase